MKRRLVGAVVLIALGVIFIPMILDGSGRSGRMTVDVEIPPAPVYDVPDRLPSLPPPVAPDEPREPAQRSKEATLKAVPAGPQSDTGRSAAPVSDSTPAEAPKETEAVSPSAWVVQVGSFEDEDKALALRDRLRQAGFPAFVESHRSEREKILYRVRVGPELKRELAEQALAKLKREQDLDGLVVSHP